MEKNKLKNRDRKISIVFDIFHKKAKSVNFSYEKVYFTKEKQMQTAREVVNLVVL